MKTPLLFLNVIIIATCGLIYELLAGTLSSYVLGDSITQFSFIIGIYLFAMGVGSFLSRFIDKNVAEKFIDIELAVAVVGGFSAPLLFLTFAYVSYLYVVLYCVVFAIGVFVGLEIPLLLRILNDQIELKRLVSRVLAFDYVGALLASSAARAAYGGWAAISALTRSVRSGGSAREPSTRSSTVTVSQSIASAWARVSSIWVTGRGSGPWVPSGSIGSWHTS
jgi:hypothetical protein